MLSTFFVEKKRKEKKRKKSEYFACHKFKVLSNLSTSLSLDSKILCKIRFIRYEEE